VTSSRTVSVKLRAEIADFKRAMDEAAKSTDKLGAGFDRNGKAIETTSGRMVRSAEMHREGWDRAGRSLTLFGAAGVAALGLSAKAAMDWESAWTGVLKTVNGSHDELAQLEDDLRAMALRMPATAKEIAGVAEAAGQLGVKTKSVAAFTEVMVNLGETTNLTADEAATSIAQLMNVMQTSAADVDNLGSALVALGNNGASTERDIVQMAQRISGAGKIIGLSESDVLGLANALASVGIEVEAGGSAISNVMIDISKSVSKGGDDLAGWAKVAGLSADEFGKKWKAEPAEALVLITEGLGRMNATGGDVLTTLDGLGQTDVRVTRALLSMAGAGTMLRDSLKLGNEAWADNTALVAEAEKRYDTTEAKVAMARNALNDAAITIGEDLLPMLAQLAGAVADVAGWFADLPDPVRKTLTGLTGVVGVTALAAGAFLTLFPRIMDVTRAFGGTGTVSAGAASGIGKVGKAAGIATVALVVLGAAAAGIDAALTNNDTIAETTKKLLAMSDAANTVDFPWTWDMAKAFKMVEGATYGAAGGVDKFLNGITFGIPAKMTGVTAARTEFDKMGQSLASIYASNPGLAAEKFNAIQAETGATTDHLLGLMPAYADALAGTENATTLTADATGGLTTETEALATQTGLTQEALDKWRESAANADAAFLDIVGAYDSAIAQNTALAQSTADATESADDSWQTYYDGVSVSSTDYIAQLQAQVDAQTNWETNMLDITKRVNLGMTGDMRDAGNAMIDELINLGPEGAAQVDLLRSMTDVEFAKVVTLWGEKGTEAVMNLVSQVEAYRHPVITPNVDFSFANSQMKSWTSGIFTLGVQPRVATSWSGGQTRADGGTIPGSSPHPRADNIPIMATAGEFMQSNAAVDYWGDSFMEAVNRRDAQSVWRTVAARGLADGGPVTGSPAFLSAPMSQMMPSVSTRGGGLNVVQNITTASTTEAVAQEVLRYLAMAQA